MPPHHEEVITRPLSTKELRIIIARAHRNDQSTAMLTQELLAYLAMFIRTDPHLFSEMLSLRVGLIIQVMAAELARATKTSLSGRELAAVKSITAVSPGSFAAKCSIVDTFVHGDDEDDLQVSDRQGQWLRRRRLDGALNRVPVGFYSCVWRVLERCPGVWAGGHCLQQTLTREMTPGELKFALRVEDILNKVPEPEYRQMLVEALMVLNLIVENEAVTNFSMPIDIETIVQRAHALFLEDQRACRGNSTLCCAGSAPIIACCRTAGLCQHFLDSAPSGCFGTMMYLVRSVAYTLHDLPQSVLECPLS
ncbi:hypothetical protein MTO96_029755 [Rhipicephalus appendiculatus]